MAKRAARRDGVIGRDELVDLGFRHGAIEHRLATGRLHLLHKGVYAVGHPRVSYRGELHAAVLACGPAAVLSHWTAAAELDLLRRSSRRIHLTVPRTRKSVPGLTLHRSRHLPAEDRAEVDDLPVTSVARTIADLAAVAAPREVERAIEQAERLRIFDLHALHRILGRSRGRAGARLLRAVLAGYDRAAIDVRLELERLFLRLCREAGFPEPALNVTVAGYEVDALFAKYRIAVELDGYDAHGGRLAFEDDHLKTAALQLADYRVARVTWRMITRDAATVVALLRTHGLPAAG